MKKTFALMALLVMISGCTTKTQYGDCIGAFEDGQSDLKYKLSVRNTVLAVLFSETIFVPVIVVANDARCPVGNVVPAQK